jgi:hypothetical protein
MPTRPPALAAAVVLMLVIGAGLAVVGALLVAVALGGAGVDVPANASAIVVMLGAVGILAALLTFAAATGLWLRRGWGWVGSFAIAVAASLGAVIALTTSGGQPPVLAGLGVTLAAAILLSAPATRRASGIA